MKQYLDLLQDIRDRGTWKDPARENMPKTKSLFGTRMEFDMGDGFPLLTTKKMFTKAIIVELLWFIRGGTNIKYLVDNGCNIWNQDAYRWYLETIKTPNSVLESDHKKNPLSFDRFMTLIKSDDTRLRGRSLSAFYKLGDLGKVYGHQWRNQNGVDQVADVISTLRTNPLSRYLIIDGWNKADFKEMALPPCHLLYQFNCRPLLDYDRKHLLGLKEGWKDQLYMIDEDPSGDIMDICDEEGIPKYYLDLQMYQRSCDTFLGVPFNIASSSLLLHLVAKTVDMIPGKFVWLGGDTHVYDNHTDQVNEQLSREPMPLPKLHIKKNLRCLQDIEYLRPEDIAIEDYKSHDRIKADLSVGL